MIKNRIFCLNSIPVRKGTVIYLMSRDQRVAYNHALLYAIEIANSTKSDLIVCFNLMSNFLNAPLRHFDFMLQGLKETAKELELLNIPFTILFGDAGSNIPSLIEQAQAGLLITDFDPLKIKVERNNKILAKINIAFHEVDTHNIIPARFISQKEEFAAYTLRPKINKLKADYLEKMPVVERFDFARSSDLNNIQQFDKIDYSKFDNSVSTLTTIKPGRNAALATLDEFVKYKLKHYHTLRNHPETDYQSDLSPYLHFGNISSLETVLRVMEADAPQEAKDSFIEEIFVRKELADNFCLYNSNYDNSLGFKDWAKQTLAQHQQDRRDYLYTLSQLEHATTHDVFWNAAQMEMVTNGKMHGYMRMYWAKKILEWTESPEQAMSFAIYLNDRYSIDGRDPNGYTGIAWSIGGIHDRAWQERPIFGKIRYMNDKGLTRKFDMEAYLRKVKLIKLI